MADDFSPEMIDGLRDLCLAIAQLAAAYLDQENDQ